MACSDCAYCPLLKAAGKTFHCGFLAGAAGTYVHPLRQDAPKPSAKLRRSMTVVGEALEVGTVIYLEGRISAHRVWGSLNKGGRKQGKQPRFLLKREDLDLDTALVDVLKDEIIERLVEHAVLIGGVWLPHNHVRIFDQEGLKIPRDKLKVGMRTGFSRIPRWLASQKTLA